MAQSVRAFASHAVGKVFESQPRRTQIVKTGSDSSSAKCSAIGVSVTVKWHMIIFSYSKINWLIHNKCKLHLIWPYTGSSNLCDGLIDDNDNCNNLSLYENDGFDYWKKNCIIRSRAWPFLFCRKQLLYSFKLSKNISSFYQIACKHIACYFTTKWTITIWL